MTDAAADWLSIYDENVDATAAASIVRQALRLLLRSPTGGKAKTYQGLAAEIAAGLATVADRVPPPNGDAIKTFLLRDKGARANANNTTLKAAYVYLLAKPHDLPGHVRAYLFRSDNWNVLNGSESAPPPDEEERRRADLFAAAASVRSWLREPDYEMARMSDVLAGNWLLFRKSVVRDRGASDPAFVKSHLEVTWDGAHGVLSATHRHSDRHGVPRIARGFAMPFRNNTIALTLNVEDTEAVESLLLRIPMQRRFQKMMGFTLSVTMDREPISASVFLTADAGIWARLPTRFLLSDVKRLADDIEADRVARTLQGLLSPPMRIPRFDLSLEISHAEEDLPSGTAN